MAAQVENWSVLVGGGIQLAVKTFKGRSTHHIIMTHANGLHKELWEPIIDELRARGLDWTITTFDFRGHGDSLLGENPPRQDWWINAMDTLLVINALKEKYKGPLTLVGLGHSFGASVLMIAEVIAKGTFHTLLLIEPIIRSAPYNVDDFPFSVIAAKRKESFSNMQEAVENFKSKKELYATWEQRCFDLHMTKGLREDPASGKLYLKCAPTTEEWCFKSGGAVGLDLHLNKLTNRVFIWYGEKSWWPSAFLPVLYTELRNAKEFIAEEFLGTDHFIPQQKPVLIAQKALDISNNNRVIATFMANQIENWSVLVGGGIQLAVRTFKGKSTHHVIMAHANGLHKEMWEPIIDDMRKLGFDWTITTIDFRGHGDSLLGENPHMQDWWISGVDILLVINALKEKYKGPLTLVGMGHSFGACAIVAAELIRPSTFHTLLLMEPVILPAPYNANDFVFSIRAAKRKESFSNMQEAVENFKSKKELYATWEQRCFDLHMTKGLREDPATGRLFLKCAPATESGFFKIGGVTGLNQHLHKLTNRIFLWYGGKSWWTKEYSHITLNGITNAKEFHKEMFPQNDHFLPQQIPETIAQRAVEALLPLNSIRSKL